MRVMLWCAVLLVAVSVAGCDKLPFGGKPKGKAESTAGKMQYKGTLVARVNNIPITLDDLNDEVNAFNAMVADRPEMKIATREQKVAHVKNELVRRALLYQFALDKGLERNEDVAKVLEKTKMDLLVLELMRQETQKLDVSSQEVQDAYNTYKEQFKDPEERRLREIMVPTEDEARDILIQALQGGDFAQLARDRSKTETAKDGGDTGFLARGKRSAQYDNVAFSDSLEEGKVSSVFKAPDGFYIVKLEAKRGGKQKAISEVWDDIKKILLAAKQQQKIDELIGKLSREAKIEVYEGEIK